MNSVIIYSGGTRQATEILFKAIETIIPLEQCRCCLSIAELSAWLRRPKGMPTIGVLMAGSRQDLADLMAMKDLLSDMRVILILPDRNEETISMGHFLCPRFLTSLDDDQDEVAAVMGRMMKKMWLPPAANPRVWE